MTRLVHTRLPLGLNTLATRDDRGITLRVSSTLPPDIQRAAARTAIRAARRNGWMTSGEQFALMIPLIFPVKAALGWLTGHVTVAKLAVGATASVVAVATVLALTHPHVTKIVQPPPAAAPGSPTPAQHHSRSRRQPDPLPPGSLPPDQGAEAAVAQATPGLGTSSPAPTPTPSVSVSAGTSPPVLDIDLCLPILELCPPDNDGDPD